ncbi:uncharacterized protein IL334_007640 [Kwoniella shivajii]|uniref:Pentatricopeptide repeat domain-containing protein n=1 Tax=Kwoniella shivajii TaxID=564305 RepID=A0ABZ1D980_9TREE|nr:hypothetical protein IL334_007640 [Kwoniella shivajii]
MWRSSIARKVIRLRAIRSQRYLHNYDPPYPSSSLPVLTHLPEGSGTTRQFPLYQPPPPGEYIPLTKETLRQLPSEESLNRQVKIRVTKKAIEGLPELTEDDLKDFYTDLVKTGTQGDIILPSLQSPEDRLKLPLSREEKEDILRHLENRLLSSDEQFPRNSIGKGTFSEGNGVENGLVQSELPKHYKIFGVLAQLAIPEESTSGSGLAGPSGTSKSPAGNAVSEIPLGLVSRKEWDVLFEEFIVRGDARGAEALLDVMTLHGVPIDQDKINDIMKVDAAAGSVEEISRLTAELANSGLEITNSHKDLYIRSLIQQSPSLPQNAISHLISAETAGQPYPQSSYHVVLQHLTQPSPNSHPNANTRSLAWDLFTNMRLSAHPTPTREVYTAMIRTCSEASQPEPERARDLWIEMIESEKIQPTREEYSAIIRALGSTKKDYLEAFDLLRQMLAKHHDAVYTPFSEDNDQLPKFSEYVPTLDTFTALLEGTKRAGDLNRARWVLTETVKLARTGYLLGSEEWRKGIDADLLSGVFMTYASWKPLVRRNIVKLKEGENEIQPSNHDIKKEEANLTAETEEAAAKLEEKWLDMNVLEELVESPSSTQSESIQNPSTSESDSALTPQSSADALREATALFHRIIDDISAQPNTDDYLPFQDVVIGPKLINSYISVHLVHSPSLSATKKAYEEAWSSVIQLTKGSVKPNGWTYLQILEKCAHGGRSGIAESDRAVGFEWGQEIWKEYIEWVGSYKAEIERIGEPSIKSRKKWLAGLGDRQIERTWRSAIRLFALHGQTSKSLSLLEEFYSLYPPEDITKAYKPLPELGLKIKLSTPSSMIEADVPPYMLFDDIRLLHQRLVKEEKWKEVNKVTFIMKSYQGYLKKRRDWRFKGVGQGREIWKNMYEQRERKRLDNHDGKKAIESGQGRHVDIDEVD